MKSQSISDDLKLVADWLAGGRHRPNEIFESAAYRDKSDNQVLATNNVMPAHALRDTGGNVPELNVRDTIEGIAAEVARCTKCRLAGTRKRPVPGIGSANPVVLVVGEGPGAEEDEQGLPFVGAAGLLLDKMLESIGLSRSTNCFIANVVKCRPPMNRDPAPDEQACCMPYLRRQIAVLKPRYILSVGRVPTQALLASKEGITRLRGRFHDYAGLPLLPTFHPSALLRDEALKRPAWEDLKLLRERIAGG